MRALARHLQAVRDRSSDSPRRLDLPAVTRAHSWTFRCKQLMSNARILAQLEKFARDLKTTTGGDTNRAVGMGRSVEKATGRAAPRALFLKSTFGFEMHLMV